MAAAATIPILIQSLIGDPLTLEVDPSATLEQVAKELILRDPATFLPHRFRLFFTNDSVTVLEPDTVLGVYFLDSPYQFRTLTNHQRSYLHTTMFSQQNRIVDILRLEYIIRDTPVFIDVIQPTGHRDQLYLRMEVHAYFPPLEGIPFSERHDCYLHELIYIHSDPDEPHFSFTSEDVLWLRSSLCTQLLPLPGFLRTHFCLPPNRIIRCECGTLCRHNYLSTHRKTATHRRNTPPNAVPFVETERFQCDCGAILKYNSVPAHLESAFHQNAMDRFATQERQLLQSFQHLSVE